MKMLNNDALRWVSFLFGGLALLALQSQHALSTEPPTGPESVDPLAQELVQLSSGTVRIARSSVSGKVSFIRAEKNSPIPQPFNGIYSNAPEEVARNFLAEYGGLFDLRPDDAPELKTLKSTQASNGRSIVKFGQLHQGIPVFTGEIYVHMDKALNVTSANGEVSSAPDIKTTPKITLAAAQREAFDLVAKQYDLSADTLNVSDTGLWLYNPLLTGSKRGKNLLVWRMTVTAEQALVREAVRDSKQPLF